MKAVILTGPVHLGKTTLLAKTAALLKNGGLALGGYLTPSLWNERAVEGYDMLEIQSGDRQPFLRREGRETWQRTGPFFLLPEALRHAEKIIEDAVPSGLLVVDEVGPLELEGGGIRRALDIVLAERTGPTLLVIRESILEEALGALDLVSASVIDVREAGAGETLLERLLPEFVLE